MGAQSKRAKRVRTASEFDLERLIVDARAPRYGANVYAWALADIYSAREQQMLGRFKLPVRMAESMRTDDAIWTARETRLDPPRCLPVKVVPAKGARALPIANEAEGLFGPQGIALSGETLVDLHGALVDHGIAIGVNYWTPREDGSRVDCVIRAWPLEAVRYDPLSRGYLTQTDQGFEVPIVHGDGRWIVFQRSEIEPHKHGVILPAALVWARHAFANRDWAKGSVAHGAAKMVGEMPQGMPLRGADGKPTPEAQGFLDLLRGMVSSDMPVGIRPAGSKTEFVTNTSSAWQVWQQLVDGAEKAAARIYLGTDGVLGAQGGAPGVDIQALFGVAATRVQGDLETLERGIKTGAIEPWCAMNFGDSTLAPTRKFLVPDSDAEARYDATAKRRAGFFAEIKTAREAGVAVTPEFCAAAAAAHGLDEVPALASAPAPTSEPLAPA